LKPGLRRAFFLDMPKIVANSRDQGPVEATIFLPAFSMKVSSLPGFSVGPCNVVDIEKLTFRARGQKIATGT